MTNAIERLDVRLETGDPHVLVFDDGSRRPANSVEVALFAQLAAATARASELETELTETTAQLDKVYKLREGDETLPPGTMRIPKFESIADEWERDLAALGERVAKAELENRAWRELNEWAGGEWHSVTLAEELGPGRFGMRGHRYGGTHSVGPFWYGEGATPQTAAIDLARKLGLLATDGGGGEGG